MTLDDFLPERWRGRKQILFVAFCLSTEAIVIILMSYLAKRGTRWSTWLRHCNTSLKVAGSIPIGVNGILH